MNSLYCRFNYFPLQLFCQALIPELILPGRMLHSVFPGLVRKSYIVPEFLPPWSEPLYLPSASQLKGIHQTGSRANRHPKRPTVRELIRSTDASFPNRGHKETVFTLPGPNLSSFLVSKKYKKKTPCNRSKLLTCRCPRGLDRIHSGLYRLIKLFLKDS